MLDFMAIKKILDGYSSALEDRCSAHLLRDNFYDTAFPALNIQLLEYDIKLQNKGWV